MVRREDGEENDEQIEKLQYVKKVNGWILCNNYVDGRNCVHAKNCESRRIYCR